MAETILIVDDSTFIVDGLVALLKRKYQPVPCSSGEECLSFLRTTLPSLIILDIMMEPMDGWETLSRIKADERSRHVPVLMFSAKKISPEEAETHRIIIDDFISKPVNPQKLMEAIDKVLARQAFNRQVLAQWTAAGVRPAVIDQYLSLKMNLDVDISLLGVMQKQLEISSAGSVNREDIAHSIATIEERIAATRALIGTFCREQGGTLPVIVQDAAMTDSGKSNEPLTDPAEHAGFSPVIAPASLPEHARGASPSSPAIGESLTEPVPECPLSPVLPDGDIFGLSSIPPDTLPIFPDRQEIPPDRPAVILPDYAPDIRKSASGAAIPDTSPGLYGAEELPEQPDQIPQEAGQPGGSLEPDEESFEPVPPQKEQEFPRDFSLSVQEKDTTKKPEAPLQSRPPGPSSLRKPGSGTVTPPMLNVSSRRRSEPAKPSAADGIISRIITTILELFRGRTR